ncbi:spermatogenesis-associated protein 20-like isoform X1 [Centruroides sculpturatus]|uniref:spermatogenesis-associated protein 20-like isoform X1 n=2 Tax=Centruroides sculpturatus TaxID=218467 RepID=UPI000C6EBE1D|nr:spermatogenesis-associated protein 20-like isoform X1 [Centruroides sculpturatus]
MNIAKTKHLKVARNVVKCLFNSFKAPDIIRVHNLRYFITERRANVTWMMACELATTSQKDQKRFKNRLSYEKSSYLLQHASNPVDWYPWGEEAFQKAKSENKLIFLSVGYSTCHWCHVMERESFENENVAKIMNENFVNIKVDREERPDVDKVYMTFVQATTGSGGWPMSVWLTPDLKPIFGGTYFPPEDKYFGRPSFVTVMKHVSEQWRQHQDKVCEQGNRIMELIKQNVLPESDDAYLDSEECIQSCFKQFTQRYDTKYGGFDKAPKFPQPVNFNFLLRLYKLNPNSNEGKLALKMCLHTMIEMSKGGIHDHICQGFHRYSTDQEWHIPHFEKMLYDQGQLAVSYLEAFQIVKEKKLADIACDILNYVSRDLRNKNGGFYSAEDADSLPDHNAIHKKEGAFCIWTQKEIKSHLGRTLNENCNITLADIFCKYYNVLPKGNVDPYKDPHDELKGKNVLMIRTSEEEIAKSFNITEKVVKKALDQSKEILYEVRQKRPKPHRDDKFITSWNALMISGFSKAGQVLQEQHYTTQAIEAAKFIYNYLFDKTARCMLRSAYRDEYDNVVQLSKPVPGVLEDYAFTIRALLDLYEACYDPWCIEWALELQQLQDELFWDSENGAYFYSIVSDSSIILRLKEDQDGAEPSSNSVSVTNLLRLYNYFNDRSYRDKAIQILKAYGQRLRHLPLALPEMLCGLMLLNYPSQMIIVSGSREDRMTQEFLRCIHNHFLPFKTLILADGNKNNILYKKIDILNQLKKGQATVYVCQNNTCSAPISTLDDLDMKLLHGN